MLMLALMYWNYRTKNVRAPTQSTILQSLRMIKIINVDRAACVGMRLKYRKTLALRKMIRNVNWNREKSVFSCLRGICWKWCRLCSDGCIYTQNARIQYTPHIAHSVRTRFENSNSTQPLCRLSLLWMTLRVRIRVSCVNERTTKTIEMIIATCDIDVFWACTRLLINWTVRRASINSVHLHIFLCNS